MSKFLGFFRNWYVVTGLVVVALALVVWALTVFVPPLRHWRVLAIGLSVLVIGWGIAIVIRTLNAKKADEALEKAIAADDTSPETAEMSGRLREAMDALKKSAKGQLGYLYSKPWYVIVGPPGSGKSTAIANSGLRFAGGASGAKSLAGVGGTRNCDWWFAEEAILLDTAGRYTTREVDGERDRKGWAALLDLLKKNRPAQPLNGMIVCFGLDELLTFSRKELEDHAASVRRLIEETSEALELELPIYLVLTKSDLLPGFSEFFDDLAAEGRREVLGSTFAWQGAGRPDLAVFLERFDELCSVLSERMFTRLHAEADSGRRADILAFPSHFAETRKRLAFMVEQVFGGPMVAQVPVGLRGFYFASGTQEGSPIDRVLGELSATYGAPSRALGRGQGRAYFLTRLLTDVVAPEAGLVAATPRLKRRRMVAAAAGLAGVGVLALFLFGSWVAGYLANSAFQKQLDLAGQAWVKGLQRAPVDLRRVDKADFAAVYDHLNALRGLPGGPMDKVGLQQFLGGMGLSQKGRLAQGAERAYREGLQRMLLPRLILRVEDRLRASTADPLTSYDALKVYLMLGGRRPIARDAVRTWIEADLRDNLFPGGDAADARAAMMAHVDSLISDPQFGSVWGPTKQAPLDGAVVDAARSSAQGMSLAERAYAMIRSSADAKQMAPWTLVARNVLTTASAAAFAPMEKGGTILDLQVPTLYTREGFTTLYKPALERSADALAADAWMFGEQADAAALKQQIQGLKPQIAGLYAADYIKVWTDVTAQIRPAGLSSGGPNAPALVELTKTPSPYLLALQAVAAETNLNAPPPQAGAKDLAQAEAAKAAESALGPAAALVPGAASEGASGAQDASAQVTGAFQWLRDYVAGPLPTFLQSLTAYRQALVRADAAPGDAAAANEVKVKAAEVAAAAASAPAEMTDALKGAAAGAQGAASAQAAGSLDATYQQMTLPRCQEAIDNKYPFTRNAQADVDLNQFFQVFGPGGEFDKLITGPLAQTLDTSGPIWRWREGDQAAALFDQSSAAELQKAAEIESTFFIGGAMSLRMRVDPKSFGGGVSGVELSIGSQKTRFDAATPQSQTVVWNQDAFGARLSVLRDGNPAESFEAPGTWGLFRLLGKGQRAAIGGSTARFTFGPGSGAATLEIAPQTTRDPFSPGGIWGFRCPAKL